MYFSQDIWITSVGTRIIEEAAPPTVPAVYIKFGDMLAYKNMKRRLTQKKWMIVLIDDKLKINKKNVENVENVGKKHRAYNFMYIMSSAPQLLYNFNNHLNPFFIYIFL